MRSQIAARMAIGGAGTSVVLLLLLHALRPDLAPGSTMISEYALGPNGWLMRLCFAAFAVGTVGLLGALVGHVRSWRGWVGCAFLVAAIIGLSLGAIFPTDPASTPPDQMTSSGRMHALGFMIGVPGELFAVLFLTLELRRRAGWRSGPLVASAVATWLSLAIMIPLVVVQSGFGIPNRTLMIAYAVWLLFAAAPLARRAPSGEVSAADLAHG